MSDLEEVDVEQQLKKAEESGDDTGSIILTDKSDIDSDDDDEDTTLSGGDEKDPEEDDMGQESDVEDDDNTYSVGDFVKLGYQPEFEVQPVYKIKEITDEGKYVIERQVEEGTSTPSPETVDKEFLSPAAPKSPSPGPVTDTSPPLLLKKKKKI